MRSDQTGWRSALESEDARKWHRDAWLIVFALGCGIILLGNLLGLGPWLLASVVAVCMILYGVAIELFVDDPAVPGDTKGDSIYYLGLLFTFAALVAALITFDWGTSGGDASGTSGSIRNFGIALLTTIVGLAGRVWFTMSQESPGDIVDTTRSQLEEAVSQMKESLDRARDDLDIMAGKFRDSSIGMGAMSETIAESTKRTAETCETLDAYASHIADAAQSLTDDIGHLDSACGATARSLTALQGQAEGLGQRFGGVRARLAETEDGLGRIGRVAGPAAKRVDATLQAVERTDDAVAALGDSLSGVRGSAERATRALGAIADAVGSDEVLPIWKESVDQLHEGTRGIRGIGERASSMSAEFAMLKSSLTAARAGLNSVPSTVHHINEHLRKAGPELTASVAPVRERARGLHADLVAVGRQSGEISNTLEDARQQAQRLSAELREAEWVDTPPEPPEEAVEPRRGFMGRMGWGLKRLTDFRRHS